MDVDESALTCIRVAKEKDKKKRIKNKLATSSTLFSLLAGMLRIKKREIKIKKLVKNESTNNNREDSEKKKQLNRQESPTYSIAFGRKNSSSAEKNNNKKKPLPHSYSPAPNKKKANKAV